MLSGSWATSWAGIRLLHCEDGECCATTLQQRASWVCECPAKTLSVSALVAAAMPSPFLSYSTQGSSRIRTTRTPRERPPTENIARPRMRRRKPSSNSRLHLDEEPKSSSDKQLLRRPRRIQLLRRWEVPKALWPQEIHILISRDQGRWAVWRC